VVDARPLHAYVAKSNVASIRVLEKCGFVEVGEHTGDDGIEELLLELRVRLRPPPERETVARGCLS
jgi:RimJ/RimL family protein N-acetyltransferase